MPFGPEMIQLVNQTVTKVWAVWFWEGGAQWGSVSMQCWMKNFKTYIAKSIWDKQEMYTQRMFNRNNVLFLEVKYK